MTQMRIEILAFGVWPRGGCMMRLPEDEGCPPETAPVHGPGHSRHASGPRDVHPESGAHDGRERREPGHLLDLG
jgi:hypothetical protein